jgi:hypothetical protein
MELKVRELKESDWETMCSWWKWWRWPEMNRDLLPLNGLGGLMVYKGDIPIIAGFLYLTNSKGALLDWIVSNPEYKERDRAEAIKLLIDSCEQVAKINGYNIIFSFTRSKSLINIHEKLGYTIDPTPSHEISKKIQ